MRFDVGDFSFDILSHETVKADGGVRERFVIDGFHLGKPLDWHPNQKDREDFPGIPNRQVFEWVGREVVDVYAAFLDGVQKTSEEVAALSREEQARLVNQKIGTKRGADYRTRFWNTVMQKAEKALVASQAGKIIGEVSDAELQKAAFTEPVDLKAKTLDEAKGALLGRAAVTR